MNDKLPPSLNRFAAELEQAVRRELGPRRDRRLGRVLRARPRLLAGTTVGAVGTGAVLALVLSAAGSSPAFAVTRNHDGTYSLTLRALSAIPAANRKLSQIGVRAQVVQAPSTCNFKSIGQGAQRNIRIDARSIPRGRTLVIAAWRNARQVTVASSISKAATACVPPCPPSGAGAKAKSVQVSVGAGGINPGNSGNSGNSGKSGNSGSGNSGTSGSSGNSGSGNSGTGGNSGNSAGWTVRSSGPPGKTMGPVTIVCPGPPPPGGNSGNSGNPGNSGSGSSASGNS